MHAVEMAEPDRAPGLVEGRDSIQTARTEFDRRNEVDAGNKLIKLG
jgi:hypothetical protein